ncbi:methyl-accepting chemotaxis protein [Enterobacter sp. ECC-019]|uniref:methyl-accepting chemotaxis protein n=1 Tax=Enterobacter sp. ECC-019 TaxID=3116478 RepID=UPI00375527EA
MSVKPIAIQLRNVNQVGIRLYSLVNDTDVQIREMSVAGSQLAAGAEELNARTTDTLANLQHTAQATEQLMAAVRQSADTAADTVKLAASADDSAVKGEAAMKETQAMMKSISHASEKIVDIISVIDNIAFQTNILALNAAVEAARAGTHGRGFAVVASEVRTLAQNSASAAAEIKGLIVATVDTVASGEKTVENASGHIESIRTEVTRVSSMIKEIHHTTEEQTAALTLINRSIEQIELMAQDNSVMVAESASSTRDLMSRSTRLQDAVTTYGLK